MFNLLSHHNRRGNAFLGFLFFLVIIGVAGYIYYNSEDFQKTHRRDIAKWQKEIKNYKKSANELVKSSQEKFDDWKKNSNFKIPEFLIFFKNKNKEKTPSFNDLIFNPDVLNKEIPPDMVRHQLNEITICSFEGNYLLNSPLTDQEVLHLANIFRFCDLSSVSGLQNQSTINKIANLLKQLRYNAVLQISPAMGKQTKTYYAYIFRNDRIETITAAKLLPVTKGLNIVPYSGVFKSGDFDFTVVTFQTPSLGLALSSTDPLENVYDTIQNENAEIADVIMFGDFAFQSTDLNWDNSALTPSVARLKKNTQTTDKSQPDLLGNFWFRRKNLVEFNGNSGIINIDDKLFPSNTKLSPNNPPANKPIWTQFRCMSDDD